MSDVSTRDAKTIQYLNEAFGKERQLETSLEAHIAMTDRPPYKKRLQQHLRETKGHARDLERRIKQLGGKPVSVPVPVPEAATEVATRVQDVAQKGMALAQGTIDAVRGTGHQEKLLKNAKTEYWNEHEEIANYTAIEKLASRLGDRETAQLARRIRREEERMASFLQRLIPQLTDAVVREEIPAAERNGGRRRSSTRRTSTTSRSTSRRTTRASASRSRSGRATARSGSTRSRSTASRSTRSGSTRARSTAGSARKSTGRSTARRTTARRTTARRATAGRTTARRTTARRTTGRTTAGRTTARRTTGRSASRPAASRGRARSTARSR